MALARKLLWAAALLGLAACCPRSPEALEAEWRIEEEFGFEVVAAPDAGLGGRGISSSGMWSETMEAFLPLLEQELGRYPEGFLEDAGIRTVVLGHHLRHGERRVGGLASGREGAIYLSVPFTSWGCDWMAGTVHHEVFHMIDARWPGAFPDDEWRQLNPADFSYRHKEGEARRQRAGFVSAYATTNPTEDRAETFEEMMAHGLGAGRTRIGDASVAAKVRFLKRGLAQVEPRLGAAYWASVWAPRGPADQACRDYSHAAATKGPACRCARAPGLCVLGLALALGLGLAGWRALVR